MAKGFSPQFSEKIHTISISTYAFCQREHSVILLNVFIYSWLHWIFVAALKLSLIALGGDYCLIVMHRLLIVVASLVVEHGLEDPQASAVASHRLR